MQNILSAAPLLPPSFRIFPSITVLAELLFFRDMLLVSFAQTTQTLTIAQQSDNNDFCSACSGTGFLLCCDGCERSFHFDCVDPPIDPESHLDEPWYCRVCRRLRYAGNGVAVNNARDLFASLRAQLVTRNTTAFVLPRSISTFFEGVKMGLDGEYQLAPPPMPK